MVQLGPKNLHRTCHRLVGRPPGRQPNLPRERQSMGGVRSCSPVGCLHSVGLVSFIVSRTGTLPCGQLKIHILFQFLCNCHMIQFSTRETASFFYLFCPIPWLLFYVLILYIFKIPDIYINKLILICHFNFLLINVVVYN